MQAWKSKETIQKLRLAAYWKTQQEGNSSWKTFCFVPSQSTPHSEYSVVCIRATCNDVHVKLLAQQQQQTSNFSFILRTWFDCKRVICHRVDCYHMTGWCHDVMSLSVPTSKTDNRSLWTWTRFQVMDGSAVSIDHPTTGAAGIYVQ